MSKDKYDFINPNHYQNSSKEVWEMMLDIWGVEKFIAHCEMCAFKYRQRLGLKPDQPIERDLKKANWYESKAKEQKQLPIHNVSQQRELFVKFGKFAKNYKSSRDVEKAFDKWINDLTNCG